MGYYLQDHPNLKYEQTRPRTAWGFSKPSGLVTVHVTAGKADFVGDDWGAENAANFVATRGDAGGYHVIVDSDSTINMAPDHYMTWHTAAFGLNGPGWGVSAACLPDEWDPSSDWTKKTIKRMGEAIAAFWIRQGIDVRSAARWLSFEEAKSGRVPGLVQHGTIQPGDRYDAWVKLSSGAPHPHQATLDAMLITAILEAAYGGFVPPQQEPNDMPLNDADKTWIRNTMMEVIATEEGQDKYLARDETTTGIWFCNEEVSMKWSLRNPNEVGRLQALGFRGRGTGGAINNDGAALAGLTDMGDFFADR